MGAEVDVTNAFIVVCNEGEGGVGGDVYALWFTEPFVGACGCVGVGVDVYDGAGTHRDEEEGVVGAWCHVMCILYLGLILRIRG